MKLKEYKIGETFKYNDNINLRVEKSYEYCRGCYFYINEIQCNSKLEELTGSCVNFDRTDKTDVIFVEVED